MTKMMLAFAVLISGVVFAAPPANDNIANATVISVSSGTSATIDNSEATAEVPFEPSHAGSIASHSIWWRFTPAENGVLVVDTLQCLAGPVVGIGRLNRHVDFVEGAADGGRDHVDVARAAGALVAQPVVPYQLMCIFGERKRKALGDVHYRVAALGQRTGSRIARGHLVDPVRKRGGSMAPVDLQVEPVVARQHFSLSLAEEFAVLRAEAGLQTPTLDSLLARVPRPPGDGTLLHQAPRGAAPDQEGAPRSRRQSRGDQPGIRDEPGPAAGPVQRHGSPRRPGAGVRVRQEERSL